METAGASHRQGSQTHHLQSLWRHEMTKLRGLNARRFEVEDLAELENLSMDRGESYRPDWWAL